LHAATIAEVTIADEYKDMMLEELNDRSKDYEKIYKLHIPDSVEPALIFSPVLPGMKFETVRKAMRMSKAPTVAAAKNLEVLAFASTREVGGTCTHKESLVVGTDGHVLATAERTSTGGC
jgi:hypothetical protein